MFVLGFDPGVQGALALVDSDTRNVVRVWDIPTRVRVINRKNRTQIDPVDLLSLVSEAVMLGANFAAIEELMAPLKDGGASLQTSGRGHGYLIMACVAHKLPYERVPALTWKNAIKPGKTDESILLRARQLFPGCDRLWYSERGAIRDGRCEAAMIGLWGADFYAKVSKGL